MAIKVSIILPIYNYAHYLDERITSLLTQTFRDFELIAVDDGSSDNSRAVVDRYRADPRLRTLWFDENAGRPYQRWNDGAQAATGEFLLFAGADDSCSEILLQTLVDMLESDHDVSIAHTRSWVVNSAGQRIKLFPSEDRWSRDFVATGAEEAPFLFRRNTIPNASAALLRRSVFEQCGGFRTEFRLCADYLLWAQMLKSTKVAFAAEPLNYFREHDRTLRTVEGSHNSVLEKYKVLAFMLGAFQIPNAVRNEAFERLTDEWTKRLWNNRTYSLQTNRLIYRQAGKVDPLFRRRLIRAVGHRTVTSVKQSRFVRPTSLSWWRRRFLTR